MRRLMYSPGLSSSASFGLLLLRLVVGAAFVLHGWGKIQNPLHWMGPGASVPAALQLAAAVSEFGGGIALILGLLTRLFCLGLVGTMTVAVFMAHIPQGHPFVGKPGQPSFELAAVYLACAILFLLVGPGWLSLDAVVFGKRRGASG